MSPQNKTTYLIAIVVLAISASSYASARQHEEEPEIIAWDEAVISKSSPQSEEVASMIEVGGSSLEEPEKSNVAQVADHMSTGCKCDKQIKKEAGKLDGQALEEKQEKKTLSKGKKSGKKFRAVTIYIEPDSLSSEEVDDEAPVEPKVVEPETIVEVKESANTKPVGNEEEQVEVDKPKKQSTIKTKSEKKRSKRESKGKFQKEKDYSKGKSEKKNRKGKNKK